LFTFDPLINKETGNGKANLNPFYELLKINKMIDKEISVAEYVKRIDERQQSIENMILSQKNVLTLSEGATYMGVSESYLYKLTSLRKIPFYKPRGKMNYFNRLELENWLLQNRITPADEIEAKAITYNLNNRKGTRND